MSDFLKLLNGLREDLSGWLVHFVQGTDIEAQQTLVSILKQKVLRSFKDPAVISFSESPVREWNKTFSLFTKYKKPRFAPYGIAVRKEWLFERHGRPAIYGPKCERSLVPESLQFRYVDFDMPSLDFTWQREWCIAADRLELDPNETVVIVPDEMNAFELTCKIEVEEEYDGPGETITHGHLMREWLAVPLDKLAAFKGPTDEGIDELIKNQVLTSYC